MANKEEKKSAERATVESSISVDSNATITTNSATNAKAQNEDEKGEDTFEQFINMDNVHFDYVKDGPSASTTTSTKKKSKKKKKKKSNASNNSNSIFSSDTLPPQDTTFFNYLLATGKAYADQQKQLHASSCSSSSTSLAVSSQQPSSPGTSSPVVNDPLVKLFSIPGIEETLTKGFQSANEIMKDHFAQKQKQQKNSNSKVKSDYSFNPNINPEDSRFVDAMFHALDATAAAGSSMSHAIATGMPQSSSSNFVPKCQGIPVETMKKFMAAVGKSMMRNDSSNPPLTDEHHTCLNCGHHGASSVFYDDDDDEVDDDDDYDDNDDELDDIYDIEGDDYRYDDDDDDEYDDDDDDDDYPTNRVIRQNEKGEVIVEEMFIEDEHGSIDPNNNSINNNNSNKQKLKSYKFSVPADAISKYLPHLDQNPSPSNGALSFAKSASQQQQQVSQKGKKNKKGSKLKQVQQFPASTTNVINPATNNESSRITQIDMGITDQKFGASNLAVAQLEEYWGLLNKDEKYKVLTFSIVKLRHTTKKSNGSQQKLQQSSQQISEVHGHNHNHNHTHGSSNGNSNDDRNDQNDSNNTYPSIDILLDQFIDKLLNFVKRQGIDSAFELLLNNNASLFDVNMAEEDLFKEMMQFAMMKDSEKSNPATSNKLYKSLFEMVESSPQMKTVLNDDFSYLANDLVSNQGKNFLQLMENVSLNDKIEGEKSQEKTTENIKHGDKTNYGVTNKDRAAEKVESDDKTGDDGNKNEEHSTDHLFKKLMSTLKTGKEEDKESVNIPDPELQSQMPETLSSKPGSSKQLSDKTDNDNIHDIDNEDEEEEEDSFYNEAIKGYSENMLFAEKNIRSVYLAFVADNLYGIYKQRISDLKTQELLDELKREEERKRLKEEKKEQDRIKKREKKKLIQQQKEAERLKKEQERLLKEKMLKEEQLRKTEEGRRRKEEEKKRKEEEKRIAKKKKLEKKKLREQELERQLKEKREKKEKELQEKKKKLQEEKERARIARVEKQVLKKRQKEEENSQSQMQYWNSSSSATANSNTIDEDDELLLKSAINGDLSADLDENTIVASAVAGVLPPEDIIGKHSAQPLASSSNFRSDSPFSDVLTPTSQYSPSNNNSNLSVAGAAAAIPGGASSAAASHILKSPSLLNMIPTSQSSSSSQIPSAAFATTTTSPFFDTGLFSPNINGDVNGANHHVNTGANINGAATNIWNNNEIPLTPSFMANSFSSNSFAQAQPQQQLSQPSQQNVPPTQQPQNSQSSMFLQMSVPECITKAYCDCFMNNYVAMQDLYQQTRRYLGGFQLLTFTDFMSIVTKMPNVEFLYDKFGNSTHMKIVDTDGVPAPAGANTCGFGVASFGTTPNTATGSVLGNTAGAAASSGFHFGSSANTNMSGSISQGSSGLNFSSIW